MALMHWYDKYSVNIKDIDRQHQKIIILINELDAAQQLHNKDEVLARVFKELIDYTKTHFEFEEKMMIENGYPDYLEHLKIHRYLIKQLDILYKSFQSGHAVLDKLLAFLKNWLITHIMGVDKQYSPYLNSKGVH